MMSDPATGARRRLTRAATATALSGALLLTALGPAADAATGGPTPLRPYNHRSFSQGAKVTFKVRDTSANARKYGIFLTVADRKQLKNGVLQRSAKNHPGTFAEMKRHRGGIYTYTLPKYDFPGWIMVTPRKYFWQAHHIDCAVKGCEVGGGIRTFTVK
jgi:hypothetical protein